RGGRAFSRLLDGMAGKLEGDAAGRGDAFAHAPGQIEVMAVAPRKGGAGLGDPDDRLAGGELGPRDAVVEGAVQIERRHAGVFRIVEPELRPQLLALRMRYRVGTGIAFLRHDDLPVGRPRPLMYRRLGRPGRRRRAPAIGPTCSGRPRCRHDRSTLRRPIVTTPVCDWPVALRPWSAHCRSD